MFRVVRRREDAPSRHLGCVDLGVGVDGRLTRVFGEDDPAAGIDDHAVAGGVHARLDRREHVSVLRADAGDQEWHVAYDLPNGCKLFGGGCAHHEHAVAVRVPLVRHMFGDDLVERLGLRNGERRVREVHPRVDRQVLELARSRVGRPAEDDDPLVGHRQERFERLASEVRVDRDGISFEPGERFVDVAVVGVADVGPLVVEDDRHTRRHLLDVGDRVLQRLPPTMIIVVEGDVGLVRHHQLVRLVDDPLVEREQSLVGIGAVLGADVGEIAVEPDAEGLPLGHTCPQQFHEVSLHEGSLLFVLPNAMFQAGLEPTAL